MQAQKKHSDTHTPAQNLKHKFDFMEKFFIFKQIKRKVYFLEHTEIFSVT